MNRWAIFFRPAGLRKAAAPALARVGVARLELQIELCARGLVRVVIELDLHVDALIAHIELPADLVRERHGGDDLAHQRA